MRIRIPRWAVIAIACLLTASTVVAQYGNEWVDHGKTYHRFKVGATAWHRIPFSTLQAAGLAGVPVEHFQLWNNGTQVPLHTSKPSGPLGSDGFIEFYGKTNDGRQDTRLYRSPELQLSDAWSLLTDTAAYFLTVDASSRNLRFTTEANPVSANTLSPEPWFLHTHDVAYRDKLNPGFGVFLGLNVYSSSYDIGEGWTSRDISPGGPLQTTLPTLAVAGSGPDPVYELTVSGNTNNARNFRFAVNGTELLNVPLNQFGGQAYRGTLPKGLIGKPTDLVTLSNLGTSGSDRMVVHRIRITYPRTFDFGGAGVFEFSLPASPAGNYLDVANFRTGPGTPILLDLTNLRRYPADRSGDRLRFALPAGGERRFVLLGTDPSDLRTVQSLQPRTFTDYRLPQNQGDFLIIAHSRLRAAGDPVDAYRAYRASATGGGHVARIYDIDELTDQFAYGIRMHPLSVMNFLAFAKARFNPKPANVMLMGRGLTYEQFRTYEFVPSVSNLALIPTFGSPGSDNLLTSEDLEPFTRIPIGRLSVVRPEEVSDYLAKVKEHEQALRTGGQTLKDRGWTKNVVHAIGGSDPYLQSLLHGYMESAKKILEDTLFGANVKSFSNNPLFSSQQISVTQLEAMFREGINLLTYFGHSSASSLEFNIGDPYGYDNQGKYPMFLVNGCNAGNFFLFDSTRYTSGNLTLSEKYVTAKQRGSIGFVASTHFGVVNYLNLYINKFYQTAASTGYGLPIGRLQQTALEELIRTTGKDDFIGRIHAEQITLHGDPWIRLYPHDKPDYVVEDPQVRVDPTPVSVADRTFRVSIKLHNIGRAVGDSVLVTVERQLPDGRRSDLFRKRIPAIRYVDSLELDVPVNPLTDKGENRITVRVDADGRIPEVSEDNNTVTRSVMIIEDELRPVFPPDYSIVNRTDISLTASTANPLQPTRSYVVELDTTQRFDSPFKKSQTVTSAGGLITFRPDGFTPTDGTVYYWRTAPQPQAGQSVVWNRSSFVYLRNGEPGYNLSHYDQFRASSFDGIRLDPDRRFRYEKRSSEIQIRTGIWPIHQKFNINTRVDEKYYVLWGCRQNSLQFVVYDSASMIPIRNVIQTDGQGMYGSWPNCDFNANLFEFPYDDFKYRKAAVEFLEKLPDGYYVSLTNTGSLSNTSFIDTWMADTALLGSGRSLYHSLKRIGFVDIDRFTTNLPFLFYMQKGVPSTPVVSVMGNRQDDYIDRKIDIRMTRAVGEMTSPWLGTAKAWKRLQWQGNSLEAAPDRVTVDVIGLDQNGIESKLATVTARDTSLGFIEPGRYPYLRLRMTATDSAFFTPLQLAHWRLSADMVPEGALAPNLGSRPKDTLSIGEFLTIAIPFRNVSTTAFDSLRVTLKVTDRNNVVHSINMPRLRPLPPGDTIVVRQQIDTRAFEGRNSLYLNVNPDYDQPELHLYNNFLFHSFQVEADRTPPVLDVTFDGRRILNRDIVSSKPQILIRLKDENRYVAMNDTALLKVRVRHPDGTLRRYRFDGDTMKFTPGTVGGNGDNTAQIDFNPSFLQDGDYELVVNGKDPSGNAAGELDYKVMFSVVNKPMISDLMNYPNPFTTSTAFVFTLTGSRVPTHMRIQILTVTGRVVREVTAEGLGPLRIGRNVTEFKWDGTDQFGQKLANGVYLYRVIVSQNGKSLEKFKQEGVDTDRYFNEGYGKMYLMR